MHCIVVKTPEASEIESIHCLYTVLIPCWTFGPPYLGKATAAAKASATQFYEFLLGLFVFP